ncbi:MAG: S41 family peptidase [Lachnospiraceae bacterium]|nr:S41 family peptidase [Lachnospiraceae bacterium]
MDNNNEAELQQKEKNGGFWTGFLTASVIFLFIACVALSISVFIRKAGGSPEPSATGSVSDDGFVTESRETLDKLNEIEGYIDKSFIDSVSNDTLSEGLYRGMVEALDDPYATYYTPEEWVKMQEDTTGVYYGIGAYLTLDEKYMYPRITGVIPGSGAEAAGIKENDYIMEVEGEDIYEQDLESVVARIRGDEGTSVHLTIARGEEGARDLLEFDVERHRVENPTVEWEMLEDDIGYIAIARFEAVTVDQFAEALAEVKGKGAKGIILDLRSNPGGSLPAAVSIAGMMLPKGTVVYTLDRYGNRQDFTSSGNNELQIPMVVLVNGNSASASEILAGAIKDYNKGTLVGTTTFGKGIVQQIFELEDESALKITVSHYYTPNGNDIHGVGIAPDVEVEFDWDEYEKNETDNQREKAIEVLKDMMK